MNDPWLLSCICLVVTGALCVAGVLSKTCDDSTWQRIGLMVACFACFGRARDIWRTEHVQFDWFILHFGVALYAVATAVKCYGVWADARDRRVTVDRSQGLFQ